MGMRFFIEGLDEAIVKQLYKLMPHRSENLWTRFIS